MLYIIPFLISAGLGTCTLIALLGKDRPRIPLTAAFGTLLGLGLSALLTWSSFLLFDQLIPAYIIILNCGALAAAFFFARRQLALIPLLRPGETDKGDALGGIFLIALVIPTVIHATLYPYGGWDAWSCWNLKVKFLFAGGEQWQNMFDPLLWRSNISYPLLLPLMNTWVLCFGTAMQPAVPLAMSCVITLLTAAILFSGIKELAKSNLLAISAPAVIFTCLFNIKLASSQYSDLLVGAWFLSALLALFLFLERRAQGWLIIEAVFLGLLAFTKTEGLLLAGITAALSLFLLYQDANTSGAKEPLGRLTIALGIALLPMAGFLVFYAPDSHAFINGLVSAEKPATFERLAVTGSFFWHELASMKWNGFWVLALAGLIISGKKCLEKKLLIIPAAIAVYLAGVTAFYYVNTFFEIAWWLSTTLNRVLFSLTPAVGLWVFLSLKDK